MSSTSSPSPSSRFAMSSAPASTAATTPPPGSEWDVESNSFESDSIIEQDGNTRRQLLDTVLRKAAVYSNALERQLEENKAALRLTAESTSKASRHQKTKGGRKRCRVDSDDSDHGDSYTRKRSKKGTSQDDAREDSGPPRLKQPALITGAKMKDYQLDGLEWMISLDQNGISGILADEMGLGKTLQTIAFNAYLREQKNFRPFLIVCPLSVLHNWIEEYKKFAPAIPVCMYHGTPPERAELRRTVMALSREEPRKPPKTAPSASKKKQAAQKGRKNTSTKGGSKRRRIQRRPKDSDDEDDEMLDEEDSPQAADDETNSADDDRAEQFPVVITTYEMIVKDRVHLSAYDFSYIVVDEGHRLKNYNSRLMQEIKKYQSAGRMLLTGTPLHNNLRELWSLLNFILPDIFTDVDSFQQWFDEPTMQESLTQSHTSHFIQQLHAILKPFLLRRLKADVEVNLPPKKEYVIYAPLSQRQLDLYKHVSDGVLRQFLIGKISSPKRQDPQIALDHNADESMTLRSRQPGRKRKSYVSYEESDDEFLRKAEAGELDPTEDSGDIEEIGKAHERKAILKQVNNMRLQNTVMQLRKVCSHPFLFDWPTDPDTRQPILNEDLIDASGKMMVLDRLLVELFKRGHKVLLFTQFTTMLDIIEDWAIEFKGWPICRIDGSTPPHERREQMNLFQNGGNARNAPRLFLLSTRSGGLGINLTAADTVIFYDQDWNPQMDIQAQDRAHRIGQTKPVLIFRLVSKHTIETEIMQRAAAKRRLEAMVIAKDKFKTPGAKTTRGKQEPSAELAASLLKLEGEKIEVVRKTKAGKASVISDEDLEMLLDRSPEVFADRGEGWTSAGKASTKTGVKNEKGEKTAFAVYQAPADAGNAALANMFAEED